MSHNKEINVGWWQKRLDQAYNLITKTEKLNSLKCDNNHSHYVETVENCKLLKACFDLSNIKFERESKSVVKASSCRLRGNQYFGKKRFVEALNCYNEGITFAPQDGEVGDDEYTLCLSNRSASLFHLGDYQSCLMDIEEALKRNYQTAYRLLIRKAQCSYRLNRFEEARTCCDAVLKDLEIVPDDAKIDQSRCEVNNLTQKLKIADPELLQIEGGFNDHLPMVKGRTGSILKQASDHVVLRCNDEKGRHLMAGKKLEAGDIFIVEKPYASILLPMFYDHRCHHCLKSLKNFYPCPTCTEIKFCSSECRSEALESYHAIECPFVDIFHEVGIAHLALRILVVTKLSNIIELKTRLLEQEIFIPDEKSPLVCNYEAVYHLAHNSSNNGPEDILQYGMTAVLLLKCLDSSKYLDSCNQSSKREVRSFVGGLLLRHICQLVCNAHAITDLQLSSMNDQVESEEQVRVATAIYPTASMMNHSCDPNISNSFHGDALVVKTTRRIEPGEEIFNCYGPNHKHMPKKKRRELLLEQYGFVCSCTACNSEDDSDFDELSRAFKCRRCDGKIVITSSEKNEKSASTCGGCNVVYDEEWLDDVGRSFERSCQLFQDGLSLLNRRDVNKAKKRFKECYKLRKIVCHESNLKLAEVIDVLAQCCALEGDFANAEKYLHDSLKIVKDIYGDESVEYAHDLRKYSEVCIQSGNSQEALRGLEEASKLFVRYYGSDHESVRELSDVLSALSAR